MLKRQLSHYGTESVGNSEGSASSFVAGENKVTFKEAAFSGVKKDGSGDPALSFTFEKSGSDFRHVMFPVNIETTKKLAVNYPSQHKRDYSITVNGKVYDFKKGTNVTEQDVVAIAFFNFNRNLKHIMTKLATEEQVNAVRGTDYASYSKAIIELANKAKGANLEIILQYNKTDFLELPKYPAFIRKEGDTTTKFDTSKLKLTKSDVKADKEADEFASSSTSSSATDEF